MERLWLRQGHKDSRCDWVFQRKTAGFILRATARCPAPVFTDNTVTDRALLGPTRFSSAQPQLRRCVKFNKTFHLLWTRNGWNPPPVWSDLHSLCLVNLWDPFGLQHGLLASVKSPDFSKASVCYVKGNEREPGRWSKNDHERAVFLNLSIRPNIPWSVIRLRLWLDANSELKYKYNIF